VTDPVDEPVEHAEPVGPRTGPVASAGLVAAPPGRVGLLVNPTAGKGRAARAVAPVAAHLRAAGATVQVLTGTDAADALARARAAVGDGLDALVALGGDGLVNLAVQAVAGTDVALGVVPAGSGNDLGRCLGLPLRDPVAAAAVVAAGHTGGIDMARARTAEGERPFLGVLGAGFDSLVNERANRMRWPRGPQRYNLAMLAELRVFRPLPFVLTLDGERVEDRAMLVAVGNGASYGGGMRVCPTARMDDGLLEVTVVGPVSRPELVRVFPRVYRGTHVTHPAVTVHHVREVTLASDGVVAYGDGERFGLLPVTCTVQQGALRVFLPAP